MGLMFITSCVIYSLSADPRKKPATMRRAIFTLALLTRVCAQPFVATIDVGKA